LDKSTISGYTAGKITKIKREIAMAQQKKRPATKRAARVVSTSKLQGPTSLNRGRALLVALAIALIGVIVLVATKAATSNPPVIGAQASPSGYQLKWSDEFNGSSIDSTKWNVPKTNFGTSNNEDQCYLPSNATVSGGNALLTARRVAPTSSTCGTNPQGGGKYSFTSAMLSTRAESGSPLKYEFKEGYVEANIKMPAGNPFWLGFWLVGGSDAPGWPAYGEMDIAELMSARPDNTTGTYHYDAAPGTKDANGKDISGSHQHTSFSNRFNMDTTTSNTCYMCSASLGVSNLNASSVVNGAMQNYHRYGILWESGRITWYLDGYPFRSLASDGTITEYYGTAATPKVVKNADGSVRKPVGFQPKGFSYKHTILFTNSVGGNNPTSYGYTGKENSDGSYSNGNLNVLKNVGDSASTYIDYVRVYQYTGSSTTTNSPPLVSLTSPTNGQTFSSAPATVTLTATAGDADSIKSVEFYDGTTLVGTDTTAPYSITVSAATGDHTYTAKATDNNATSPLSTTSGKITVSVSPAAPSTGALSVPSGFKVEPGDGLVKLSWQAVPGADNYTVRWGTKGSYPAGNYSNTGGRTNPTTSSYIITGLSNGTTYNFSVRAKDSTGKTTDSAYSTEPVTGVPFAPNVSLAVAPASVSLKPRIDYGALFTGGSACKLDIAWPASATPGVTDYDLSINGKTSVRVNGTKYTIPFTSGAKYSVQVWSINAANMPSATFASGSKTSTCNLWTGSAS
jgi:beta-glucanase (GH16 family)